MNIIQLIENAKANFKDKIAYQYEEKSITFDNVYENMLKVASQISKNSDERNPILVIAHKNINIPSIYLGVAFSNCYYVPVSTEMPKSKIESILDITKSQIIITDDDNLKMVESLNYTGKVFTIDDLVSHDVDNLEQITQRRNKILDIDPLYVIFTSGSTGVPKGVVTAHNSVVDYVLTFVETFNITGDDIFGNQAPLDYIAGIRDIYIPMITGAKTIFIPKNLFSTPKKLFEYVNLNKVTTICWVSAALSLCCQLNVFSEIKPEYINKVFFTGSVFDFKHLNMWKKELPNAKFVNHYGPTEITASCTYYVVDNNKEYEKPAPIGKAFKNRKVFVLNEQNKLADVNEKGEICVAGACLALGYYKNKEKTEECFIKNPLNDIYNETVYRTGDIGYVDEFGVLNFCGRKDNQIKHMGHRVELGEIEDLVLKNINISEACCVYNTKKSVITLFYGGTATAGEISKYLRECLPSYMIPRKLVNMEALPKLFNGKIDRQTLIKQAENL